nr:LAGLIDADG family homing endonuclease [Paenibacillus xylanexedens]
MTVVLKDRKSYIQRKEFEKERFEKFFDEIVSNSVKEYSQVTLRKLKDKLIDDISCRDEIYADKLFDLIIREVNEEITAKTPEYTHLSAATLLRKLYKQASKERGYNYKNGYGDYPTFVRMMVEKGLYSNDMIDFYSEEELKYAGSLIDKEKDKKFSYAGLFLLNSIYLVKGYNDESLEMPQERFMTASLYLLKDEKPEQRMKLVEEAYWALSNHYFGLATPTLKSAGLPHGSLSSCHEITWNDDLYNIYDVQQQTARFSQNGAGIGIAAHYLRARGSWIRGIKNRATGVTHPARSMSVLAEYVNQLGTRVAGISIYLPVYHLDIFDFMDLRLKTGSQEKRAHSIKTAVCIPDEFMRRLLNKQTWTIVDPYEVKKKLGIDINRLYDKKKLLDNEEPNPDEHAFTYHYRLIEKADLELKQTVNASEIHKAMFISRKTGGTPYLYFSDTSARMNPNGHAGMPLGSNLCVTGDTMLLTEDGYIDARTLYEEGSKLKVAIDKRTKKMDVEDTGIEFVDAIPMQLTAKSADIFKLKTKQGFEIKATEWHKFYVKRDNDIIKIPLKDIEKGDRILLQSGSGSYGKIDAPELAYIAGIVAGDGCITENSAIIYLYGDKSQIKKDVEEKVKYLIDKYIDKDLVYKHNTDFEPKFKSGENRHVLRSALLKKVLNDFYMNETNKTDVPDFVKYGNHQTQTQYLSGLFQMDGTVNCNVQYKAGSVELTQTNKEMLQSIQIMLLNMGVYSTIYDGRVAGNYELPDGKGGRKEYICKSLFKLSIQDRTSREALNSIIDLKPSDKEKLQEFTKTLCAKSRSPKHKYSAEVSLIEYVGKEDVYDTTQEDYHSLIFNGIVTGNCSEIIQNQSFDEVVEEKMDAETGLITTVVKSGDLVTCNLSSLVLQNVFGKNEVDLQRVIDIQMRLLDNVISLNRAVVPQATVTNYKYRPVGLGTLGLATLMADEKIMWDSFQSYGYVDKLFEKIAQATILASHKLGLEKGSYPVFEGSDWNTGEYFEKRKYTSDKWIEIKEKAKVSMRNGYLMAIAPTSSNSIVMNGSPSIDPLYEVVYREVKSGLNVIITPSNYNDETKDYFKSGFSMDEMWSINIVAAASKHVDQAISHNMHVLKSINGGEMVRLDSGAWNKGVKTIYYTYTEDYERPDGCSMCES